MRRDDPDLRQRGRPPPLPAPRHTEYRNEGCPNSLITTSHGFTIFEPEPVIRSRSLIRVSGLAIDLLRAPNSSGGSATPSPLSYGLHGNLTNHRPHRPQLLSPRRRTC
jgi:hypothetical protein